MRKNRRRASIPLVAGADFDPSLRLSGYSTFAWDEADELPTCDPRLDSNPFFVERCTRRSRPSSNAAA